MQSKLPLARLAIVALLGTPMIASAALEATTHGTSTSASIYYRAEPTGSGWDWFDNVNADQSGTVSAVVPTARAQAGFGALSHAIDTRPQSLEAAFGKPVLRSDREFWAQGDTRARWWDTWTVQGGTGRGTLDVNLRYSADWIGDTFMTYVLQKRSSTDSTELFRIETGQNAMEPGDVVRSTPASNSAHRFQISFEYGKPFQLVSSLWGVQANDNAFELDREIQSMSVEFMSVVLAGGATLEVSSGDPSAYHVTAVPEPASWALMLGGIAGVLALARRRAAV